MTGAPQPMREIHVEHDTAGKVVVFIRTTPRKFHCSCGRFLGESTAIVGTMTTKCPSCGSWRKIDFGDDARMLQSA